MSLMADDDAPPDYTNAFEGVPNLTGYTRPPAELIIDPKAPLAIARMMAEAVYTTCGIRTVQHQQGVFTHWTGTHYAEFAQEEMRASIYAFLERAKVQDKKELKPFKPTTASVNNTLDALRAVCQLPNDTRTPAWLDDEPSRPDPSEIVCCRNGLLHMPSGELMPHSPLFFGSSSLSYSYDPDADIPMEWLKFLTTIWPNDPSAILTLQEIFGYLLGTDTDQQKLFLLTGPKRSGKGTIGRIMGATFGADAVVSPTLASLQTNFGLAPLINKPVGIIADARLSSRADQQNLAERLLSISGEDKQTIDRKFLPAWNGKLSTRFVIMTNELPRIADASGALASRFIVLTMTKSFYGMEDRGLTARLLDELPGILNWALAGWRRLKERGYFKQPDSSADAIADLEALSSPISAFLRDCCEVNPLSAVGVDDIYNAWVRWCKDQGRDHSGNKQTFGRDLRSAVPGLKTSQTRVDGSRERHYEGVALSLAYVKQHKSSYSQSDYDDRNDI